MDSNKSFEEKIKIDNELSNRYIELDPNGYFIIKVDLDQKKIIFPMPKKLKIWVFL